MLREEKWAWWLLTLAIAANVFLLVYVVLR